MTEKLQIYKCEICGNIVEVLHSGQGQLVCCGEPMNLLEEKTADWKNEKHVPVVKEKKDDEGNIKGIKVVVGSTLHPMEDDHYIEWIEVIKNGKAYRKFLKPGDDPKAKFKMKAEGVIAREYCNKHGLWKN